ncbi:DUF1761 domain-containing protein [Agromyces sp. SYSU T0242]|uniref:DUF1761 domain-containing protein n=1 Tax=Agromyces litoreus TaxID=3158561 RepID=UPI0033967BB3
MVWDVNWWAVLVATVAALVIGSFWYTPRVFGNYWMRVARVDDSGDRGALAPIATTVLMSAVSAWVLAVAVGVAWTAFGGPYVLVAVGTAALLWTGFTAARFLTHDAFEGRPAGLTAVNVAHEAVTFLVMAVIIGVWPPAGTT